MHIHRTMFFFVIHDKPRLTTITLWNFKVIPYKYETCEADDRTGRMVEMSIRDAHLKYYLDIFKYIDIDVVDYDSYGCSK